MSLHHHLREQARREHGERLHRMAGGMTPAEDAKSDQRIAKVVADREVKRGIREHDSQLHGGKRTRLALRDGGLADGGRSAPRYDRGGRRMGMGRRNSHVSVTVMPGVHDRPMPVPVPAAGVGGGLPPRPPMMPPGGMGAAPPVVGAGVPPPGGLARPPMMPPGMAPGMMMRKDGGVVPPPIDMKAGAQSGEGRLEKTKAMRREKSAALTGPY